MAPIEPDAGRVSTAPARFPQLDALRGIAAALVVLHHAYQSWPVWPQLVRFTPARLLLNGRSSVIFFFVLSGFVLAHSLLVGKPQGYRIFVMRRIARIYLPYAVAGGIAIVGALAFAAVTVAGVGVTFNEMWTAPPDAATALGHLLLVGSPLGNGVNIPSWSLVYELRISVLIPPLVICLVAAPQITIAATIAAVGVADVWLARNGAGPAIYAATGIVGNLAATAHFVGCFFVGILLARAEALQLPVLRVVDRVDRRMLAFAALALMMIFRDATCTVGSALILALALRSEEFARWLSHPRLVQLGTISFSLYLTHMIVIEATVRALNGLVPPPIALGLALVLVLPCAILFCSDGGTSEPPVGPDHRPPEPDGGSAGPAGLGAQRPSRDFGPPLSLRQGHQFRHCPFVRTGFREHDFLRITAPMQPRAADFQVRPTATAPSLRLCALALLSRP